MKNVDFRSRKNSPLESLCRGVTVTVKGKCVEFFTIGEDVPDFIRLSI